MQAASPITGSECVGVDAIRARFPALERRHRGRPVAYFDGPGGTQTPRDVVEAMVDYLYHHNANTHWRYPSSVETDAMIGAARVALADFLGAHARGDRLRRQHDDPDLPPGAGPRPHLEGRATRS